MFLLRPLFRKSALDVLVYQGLCTLDSLPFYCTLNVLRWNIFVTGNVIIILLKVILQVVGCVHLPALRLKSCWVIQLFGIACLKFGQLEPLTEPAGDRPAAKTTGGGGSSPNSVKDSSSICTANTDDAGLVWDAVVFVFLLIQKRIFSSWYFQWVVLEHKVQSALASRYECFFCSVTYRLFFRKSQLHVLSNIQKNGVV